MRPTEHLSHIADEALQTTGNRRIRLSDGSKAAEHRALRQWLSRGVLGKYDSMTISIGDKVPSPIYKIDADGPEPVLTDDY